MIPPSAPDPPSLPTQAETPEVPVDYYAQLNPRQKRFVREYVRSGNATQSYIAAGYEPASADSHAIHLKADCRIAQAIAVKQAELSARAAVQDEELVARLKLIALYPLSRLIGGLKGFRVQEQIKALELLGRWRGLEKRAAAGQGITLIVQQSQSQSQGAGAELIKAKGLVLDLSKPLPARDRSAET